MIRRMALPLLALATVGVVAKTAYPDIARYLKIRNM
ncbi:hypothetical protein BH18ACT3_BH18ACT3_25970 [soil metagenome]